jgi:polyisoprenoid-binding protein YceI
MARWFLEPGHTAAEFCVRHMMVTNVRGHFKDVHGTLPTIRYSGRVVRLLGASDYQVQGDLTVRGVARAVLLDVRCTGRWSTPWWEGGVDRGPRIRCGFVATGRIDRRDFGVRWNSPLPGGGFVVGDDVLITVDAEAILEAE